MKRLEIKQIKSTIGTKPVHRKNIKALGLTKVGQTVIRNDDPTIRGMIFKCSHLLEVKEID